MTTIRFHDVSHHQGDFHPAGPLIAKATQGGTFVDPQYATNRARTIAGGWPFAGYHWIEAGHLTPIPAQIEHALAVIGTDTPMMADVEVLRVAGQAPSWPTFSEALQWYEGVLAGGAKLTLDYIPEWFWAGPWQRRSLKPFGDLGPALISSVYPAAGYTSTGPGWTPYGDRTPAIWQYASTPIDTNAYRGTLGELAALFEGTTDMALTDDDATKVARAVLNQLVGASKTLTVGIALERAAGVPAELAALGTPAAIAAAVVAALPPAAAGGATPEQVAQAVHDGLAQLQLTVAP
jgi:Glycosyl hydrolases family 25